MNYFRFYVGDYLSKTNRLSLSEHGAYLRLMLECYGADTDTLPADPQELYRICGAVTTDEQKAVKKVADRFFPVNGDGHRHNKRIGIELPKALQTIERQREAALQTNARRYSERSSERSSDINTEALGDTTPIHQPLTSIRQPPDAKRQPPDKPGCAAPAQQASASPRKRRRVSDPAKTAAVEHAYSEAYFARYGAYPVVNEKFRGQLSKFLDRVAKEEAPGIAAFYVRSNYGWYVKQGHSVDYLLKDAEKLRTQWITGKPITETEARQIDRTQANADSFGPLIEEAEEREGGGHAGK